MNNNPEISVIIPVYNAGSTILNLTECILREKNVTFEIIIVNDGSTDNTGESLQSLKDNNNIIVIEQENKGVYAARNAALAVHRGEWVVFLDADDTVEHGFLSQRLFTARQHQADVVIFNANRATFDSPTLLPVHKKQPYDKNISGHEWIKHCVTNKEWPHYLWLQIVKSDYIKSINLKFQEGKSHKDILWTICLATANGVFHISNIKDYIYIQNKSSITNRKDYFDVRAESYVDIIAYIIKLSEKEENREVRSLLVKHALVESRHFLGLYRNKVFNRKSISYLFRKKISFHTLIFGVSSLSDAFFLIKLAWKILLKPEKYPSSDNDDYVSNK